MRKSKVGCFFAYTAIFCGVLAVAGNRVISEINADSSSDVWGHYSAVNPKLDKDGCKEYWVNCSTGEIKFSAPQGATIVNKGAPTDSQIADMSTYEDGRIVKRLRSGTDSSILEFGMYPQDDFVRNGSLRNYTNASEQFYLYTTYEKDGDRYVYPATNSDYYKITPIKWRILDSSDLSNVLVVSDKCLDKHAFSSDKDYSNSSFQYYLNNTFYNLAFTSNNIINTTTLSDVSISAKIFLLSVSEIETYFPTSDDRYCTGTRFASVIGLSSNPSNSNKFAVNYWTRTSTGGNISYVSYDGNNIKTTTSYTNQFGIRPAMRLNLA